MYDLGEWISVCKMLTLKGGGFFHRKASQRTVIAGSMLGLNHILDDFLLRKCNLKKLQLDIHLAMLVKYFQGSSNNSTIHLPGIPTSINEAKLLNQKLKMLYFLIC